MKSNKKKNNKLKKYLGLLFIILAVGGWFAGAAYIGKQSEQLIRESISQTNTSKSSFYFELIEYKRSLLHASFKTRLHANDKKLDNALNQLVFHTDVKHGPLIFNSHDLQLALITYSSRLDKTGLDENMNELVERLFADKAPFIANMYVDYELNKHLQLDSNSFVYQVSDIVLKVSNGSLSTVVKSNNKKNSSIEFEMDNITFNDGKRSLESLDTKIVFNLFGDAQSQLTSSMVMTDSTKYTNMSVNLDDLRLIALFDWLANYEDRFSIDQQIEWTLEDASQYQEGQDHLIALFNEQENKVLPDTDKLVSQLFRHAEDDITYLHKIENIELANNLNP
jgi:hypothetical protein